MKKNQKGFGFIEILLAILILVVVGFGAYYVWLNQKNPDINSTLGVTDYMSCQRHKGSIVKQKRPHNTCTLNGTTYTATQIPVDIPPQQLNSQAQSQKYLTISEWNVKIPLSSGIEDAYYLYKNGYVYLSLQSLVNTNCAADSTTLGAVTRYAYGDTDPNTDQPYSVENINSTQVGQYYYYYTHPQASCSDNQTVIDKANTAMTDFKTAVDNIQAQ